MSERQRLDILVWQHGLAPSRAQARAMVLAGAIAVDGQRETRAGTPVPTHAKLTLLKAPSRFVSRGGDKLAAALTAFAIHVHQRRALDIGASTGGFTDCLLQAGARRVYAVDVGYGQLHWRLRTDPRVVVYERTNARHLQPNDLPEQSDLLTIDVSFISLRLVLPSLLGFLTPEADVVLLIKPQFEVGKGQVGKGGIVRDATQHYGVLLEVLHAAQACGLGVCNGIVSPLLGPKGNREFFAHCRAETTPLPLPQLEELCTRLAYAESPANQA